MLAVLTHSI